MTRFFALAIVWLLAVVATAADAQDDAATELQQRLVQLDGVAAQFQQQILDSRGLLVEQSEGLLYVAKPLFRWEVAEPFPQIIVADGKQVQIYDPDLEQVTERALGESITEAPLALLTQSELAIADHYRVAVNSGDNAAYIEYTLSPLSQDALFARLTLLFDEAKLSALTIYDHVGQQTRITFSEYQANQVLQSALFQLDLPANVDRVRG